MTIRQIIVSCNSSAEASKIGVALLKARYIACYEVMPRLSSAYYWPPKTKKIVKGKGATLIATTLPRHIPRAKLLIAKKHSDKVPFIGSVEIHDVSQEYYRWLTSELVKHV